MSSENEQNDQFKLVSIEGNTGIKPNANRAKQAYSSYLKDDSEYTDSSSQIVLSESPDSEPEVTQRTPPRSTSTLPTLSEDNKPAPKKNPPPQKGTAPLKPQSRATKTQKVQEEEAEDDYFNEDGSINEDREGTKSNIDELKNSVASLLGNFVGTLSAVFSKTVSLAMKPLSAVANFGVKLINIPLSIVNKFVSSLADKLGAKRQQLAPEQVVEEAPPPPEIKKSTFNEMIELNIIFMDNYKKNLYSQQKTGAMKLSKAEEGLIMSMAMEAIRECAEFTAELPPPAEGIYAGISISQIMENITEDDVKIFLGFVKAFPGKYIGKTWKISETYATWLINNSPTG